MPTELLPGAMALRTMAIQIATVAGPALGGFIYYLRPDLPYELAVGLMVLALACVLALRSPSARRRAEAALGGLDEPGRRRRVRAPDAGAAGRDLARPVGGAVRGQVALAPLFARSILHVGRAAWGCCGPRPPSA